MTRARKPPPRQRTIALTAEQFDLLAEYVEASASFFEGLEDVFERLQSGQSASPATYANWTHRSAQMRGQIAALGHSLSGHVHRTH